MAERPHFRTVRDTGSALARPPGPPHDADMEARLAKLESAVDGLKDQVSGIRGDFYKAHVDMQRWMVATILAIAGLIGGSTALLANLSKPAAAPAPSAAPYIIQIPAAPAAPAAPAQPPPRT